MTEPDTSADYAQVLADEYSYRANQPIYVDGIRAYNEGHLVPASNVEKFGYLDDHLVDKVTGDAASPAVPTAAGDRPTPAPSTPAGQPVSTEKKD